MCQMSFVNRFVCELYIGVLSGVKDEIKSVPAEDYGNALLAERGMILIIGGCQTYQSTYGDKNNSHDDGESFP